MTTCFAAYDDVYPLAAGWPDRVALHQIAPLVVHAVKFGGGYVAAATEAIARTPERRSALIESSTTAHDSFTSRSHRGGRPSHKEEWT